MNGCASSIACSEASVLTETTKNKGRANLVGSLLKKHVRANDEVAAMSLGAIGERCTAGHVRRVQHDGSLDQQRIWHRGSALRGDSADNDANLVEALQAGDYLRPEFRGKSLGARGGAVVDEHWLLDALDLAQSVHGRLGRATRADEKRTLSTPCSQPPHRNTLPPPPRKPVVVSLRSCDLRSGKERTRQ